MPTPAQTSQPAAAGAEGATHTTASGTVTSFRTDSASSHAQGPSVEASVAGAPLSPVTVADVNGDSAEHVILKNNTLALTSATSGPAAPGLDSASAAAERAPTSSATSTGETAGPNTSNAAARPARPQTSHGSLQAKGGQQTVVWSADVENTLLQACLHTLNYAACRDLERRVRCDTDAPLHTIKTQSLDAPVRRSGSGTEDRARQAPCCPPAAAAGVDGWETSPRRSDADGSQCCYGKKCTHKEYTGGEGGITDDGDNHSKGPIKRLQYRFQKDPNDHLGELLDSWVAPSRLHDLLGRISERAAKVFHNVLARGRADGMEAPTGAEEKQLRLEILREATIREVQLRILEEVYEEKQRDSREGGMLASPLAFKGHLSHLLPETIADLMKEGVAVQRAFVGESVRKLVLKEVELLEYDGRFNEVFQQSLHRVRRDYMCWLTLNDLDREKQQGLWQLFQSMQALPYELNKKAHLYLQVSWVFQLAVYQGDGAYYRRHMDAGFLPTVDNGRKITAVYYPNPADWQASDGGYLRVYPRWRRKQQLALAPGTAPPYESETNCIREIQPAGDTLVLLRSREMPHEVLETYRKRFAISLWMSGPPGPGDDV